MATEIPMPQLGESVVEGTIGKWRVREGDTVEKYDVLLEVSTDKVDTEITAPVSGTLLRILVQEGETVHAGTPIALVGEAGEALAEPAVGRKAQGNGQKAVHGPGEGPARPETAPAAQAPSEAATRLSPVVARIASENNVDVTRVTGTGLGGRITKKDMLAYLETRAAEAAGRPATQELKPWETPGSGDLFKPAEPWRAPQAPPALQPEVPAARPAAARPDMAADEELLPLSAMRRSIARHMVASKYSAPHVTTVFEVDMSRVAAHRQARKAEFERLGVNLTYTAYFVEAVVAGLKAQPQVNSSFSDEGLILKKRIHIGMAVDIGDGLIVPVIRDADELNLKGLARVINDLAARARARKLSPDEASGSTFTITNHGVSGSLFATPIINQPNVGILGVGAVQKRVVVIDDAIAIRPLCYMTLTFDHRALDGAIADHFMAGVKRTLENYAD